MFLLEFTENDGEPFIDMVSEHCPPIGSKIYMRDHKDSSFEPFMATVIDTIWCFDVGVEPRIDYGYPPTPVSVYIERFHKEI